MKAAILILTVIASAIAAPQHKVQFLNLYKQPIGELRVKPAPRIIGGQEAVAHSIPYQAFLELYTTALAGYCGGSLISTTYVVTAAHCGAGVTEAHVTLGAHSINQKEDTQVTIISKEIIVHEDYDAATITNDLAVIKLPEAVTLTDAIQPVKIPSRADDKSYVGDTARISGWGRTNGFEEVLSAVLEYVDVRVITNKECARDYEGLLDSIVCTSGDDRTGSCNGDSGGPLVVDNVQIGLVSYMIQYCLPGYPSAFTRFSSFLDWFAKNTDVQIK